MEIIIGNLENIILRSGPDIVLDPFYILLATDGAPDTCINPDMDGDPLATQKVVEQAQRAFNLGVNTYVLSVGDDTSNVHLQDVANAGTGTQGAPFWKANNPQGLQDALSTIIGAAASCELKLDHGDIVDKERACLEGEVILNGKNLECSRTGSTDGWRVVDSTTIELTGSACNTYKSSPSAILTARFPCGVIVG